MAVSSKLERFDDNHCEISGKAMLSGYSGFCVRYVSFLAPVGVLGVVGLYAR
jgi:hypothetical protein